MAIEIERKFLVHCEDWARLSVRSDYMKQGYLAADSATTVRVRVANDRAWLTIKGVTNQISRKEYEYAIPVADGIEMLDDMCGQDVIEKTRYYIEHANHTWEIDVFQGSNLGLVVAEIELSSEDEHFEMPDWIDREVSNDARYFNVNLMKAPYNQWPTK
jgi:adenylate cyclase